jgi:protein-S-isoprenylcysteine O-methyltransferase Ste14
MREAIAPVDRAARAKQPSWCGPADAKPWAMGTLATTHGPSTSDAARPQSLRRILLLCGIAAALFYGAMNAFVPLLWSDYSSTSQTVSELSAIGAPTRPIWVALGLVYSVLYAAFGAGVWSAGDRNRPLRVSAALMITTAVLGLVWPPMHLRPVLAAGGGTLTDTLHIVWTSAWGLLSMTAMGFGAAGLGRRFRFFTVACLLLLLALGGLTSLDAPRITLDLPTPWIGVWERLNIACYYVWLVVFAIALLRVDRAPRARGLGARIKVLVGAGDRIMLYTLPFAVVGVAANVLWPSSFHLGLGTAGLVTAAVLLALGVPLWLTSVVQILLFVPKGKLITRGPFAIMIHPLYTSVALLVIPACGLLFDSWLGFVLGLVLYVASRRFAPNEERELAERFPDEYPAYREGVLLPWL